MRGSFRRLLLNIPGFLPIKSPAHALFCFTLIFFLSTNSSAQQVIITGIVTEADGTPLAGATITNKSSGISTVSDAKGDFHISAGRTDILLFTYVGFASRELLPGIERPWKIVLMESPANLDAVVLTGYSVQKVKDITGSVSIVKPKDLISVPAGQVEQMLQGRVAGLTVITSGMPGGGSNVRLHGIGNFGDVTPLYIIDGVQGDVNNLNPNDIESLQVLKDAGAYAIYGVRGANGVIVITTKRGKAGRTRLQYDFYSGYQVPLKKGADLLNPTETGELTWLALKNSGRLDANGNPDDPYYGNGPNPVVPDYLLAGPYRGVDAIGDRVNPDLYNNDFAAGNVYQIVPANKAGTDWFHELFNPAFSQNHTLALSGGNDKNKYLFSIGYLDQQGTLLNTYLKRFTVRLNTTFALNEHIRFGENLQLSYRDNPRIATQKGPNNNEVFGALAARPILPVYDIKGGWASFDSRSLNENYVAARVIAKDNKTNYWEVFGNAWGEADFLKYFTFRTQFGGTLTNYYVYDFSFGGYVSLNGLANNAFQESAGYRRSWTWTNIVTFTKSFLQHHLVKVLAGTEAIDNYNREVGGRRIGYFTNDPNYRFLSNGSPFQEQTNYSFAGTSTLSSFIGRLDYGYKEKYLVSATIRNDGSSVFGPGSRYGWFPSISAAWRITAEEFAKNSSWVNELKLRGSWGRTGYYGNTNPFNQYSLYGGTVGDAYYDIAGNSTGYIRQGFRATQIGDPKTGWQEDRVINAGIESVFWKGKLSVTIDLYKKESKGLLFPISLPDIVGGATPPNVNIGNVQNKGLDVLLGSRGQFSKRAGWDAILTFTTYKSNIVKLNDVPFFIPQGAAGFVRNEVGHPISTFYGYKIIGIFQNAEEVQKSPGQLSAAPGRFKYQDSNGDGIISDADRVFFGNPNPKFTLGLNISFTYANFDFSTFLYGSFGNDVLNVPRNLIDFYGFFDGAIAKSKIALYDSWTAERPNAKAPIAETSLNESNFGVPNSYCLEDGSYLRNKSLIVGYTIPQVIANKVKLNGARIYVQAVNLFTITHYSGLDPELSGSSDGFGIDFGNYPNNQKQFLVGLNVNF